MTKKLKVLIVDDDPLIRKALGEYMRLDDGLKVVGEAGDLSAALQAIAKCIPDVVLVDILGFEAKDGGIGVIREIRTKHRGLPILAMSSQDSSFYAETALEAGANGYLMKQEAAENIGKVIRQIMRGERYVSAQKIG